MASDDELKMYCIYARESLEKMNGIRGKLASMAGHAYLHAWWNAAEGHSNDANDYRDTNLAIKITLSWKRFEMPIQP
jgi:hypothetical protein